ncbi:MAG: SUMF1/EgtB/PvdO family nonheme iron enzyme [Caldilineaceae bacterium]|nr:SUMF1/EgtB/PvdO family nonheme iron enzyme [Caldilineaceae bacterium]
MAKGDSLRVGRTVSPPYPQGSRQYPVFGPVLWGRLIGRVLRGGSFNNNATNVRCANRNRNNPDNRNNNVGFRVVLPHGFPLQRLLSGLISISPAQKRRAYWAGYGLPSED